MQNSPYTPGAGFAPPVLAGRDEQIRLWTSVINDVAAAGRVRAVDLILVGPRGIGKTATVLALEELAAGAGFEVLGMQAIRGRSGLMIGLRQRAEERAAAQQGRWRRVKAALDRISTVSVGAAGVSLGVGRRERDGHPVVYDPTEVAAVLAKLAQDVVAENGQRGGLMISLDEMQVAAGEDLALLAGVLHQFNTRHRDARVLFVGAGLATTQHVMTQAGVTHPDRLFRFEPLGDHLAAADAAIAIVKPALDRGVAWHPDAVTEVLRLSDGYPAHLQAFAHAAWQAAPEGTRIGRDAVTASAAGVIDRIHRQTLGPRWEQLSGRQREYLAALCVLGGTAGSAEVAAVLGVNIQDRSRVRDELLTAGDIYAPGRGVVRVSMPMAVPLILAEYEAAVVDGPDGTAPVASLAQLVAARDELRARHDGTPRGPDSLATRAYRALAGPADRQVHLERDVDPQPGNETDR